VFFSPAQFPGCPFEPITIAGDATGEVVWSGPSSNGEYPKIGDVLGWSAADLEWGGADEYQDARVFAQLRRDEPGDPFYFCLAPDGTVVSIVDTGHASDVGEANLVSSSLPAFARCLELYGELVREVSMFAPPSADLARWRAALRRTADAMVAADRRACRRDGYWLHRVKDALGDFIYDDDHLELATELVNLVLDANAPVRRDDDESL
jgi:hypothetical protein